MYRLMIAEVDPDNYRASTTIFRVCKCQNSTLGNVDTIVVC